jgi:hypothetical protein
MCGSVSSYASLPGKIDDIAYRDLCAGNWIRNLRLRHSPLDCRAFYQYLAPSKVESSSNSVTAIPSPCRST